MTTRIPQRYLWSIVIVGSGALAMSGLLLAQGQDADAQDQPDQGQATQMLVAHGLAMAIEGSTLESLAMQRGGGGAVGTGAGGAGGTVSREPYGSDAGPRDTRGARISAAATVKTDASKATGRVEARASSDPSAMELHRHAMQAFDASDRLMKQASQDANKGRAARFQAAAVRYAASLRDLSKPGDLGGITPVVVLNHGVKEALDSMKLKQLVRTAGISGTPAGRALLAHAREMDTASKQAVESVLSAGKAGSSDQAIALGANKEAGARGGQQLRTLALQASEVVMALDELTGEGGTASKEKQKGSDPEQPTSKPDAPE